MEIESIREKIVEKLDSGETIELWFQVLNDTTPGHYGVEDIDVNIKSEDIWVDVPARTFSFKKLSLSFKARLWASNDRDGYDENFKLTLSGDGHFDFKGPNDVTVKDFHVNEPLDLYD